MKNTHIYSKNYLDSAFISIFICSLIALWCVQTSIQFQHWFLIPVVLSGILIGIDTVRWFCSYLTIFDPVGIIGILGFHFFFLAPILHVTWDKWLEEWFDYPPDWRPWVGGMAFLNLFGLILYRFCINQNSKQLQPKPSRTVWQVEPKRFFWIISFAMIFSAVLQIGVYQQFGGIMGYIASATDIENRTAWEGMGIVFLFSESFPILAMMAFALYARSRPKMQSWSVLIVVLLIFLVLQLFFGGLRGSRSNTIWALFWVAGIIHFMIRPITKKDIAFGLVFLMIFMYIYGFFKNGGLEGIQTALQGQEARAELEEQSGRTWEDLVLGDLGRTDVQAYMLYKLKRPESDYKYVWGETYLAALTILIPKAIMPEKPFKDKVLQGTNLLYGANSYIPNQVWSSKVYGIAGEVMLNFEPYVVPLMFIPFGLLVKWVQQCLLTWNSSDSRLLLLPMLVNFCFVVLVSDLDNDIFFLVKNSGLPTFAIWFGSTKKLLP